MTPGSLTCEISRRPCWRTFYVGLAVNATAVLLVLAIDPSLHTILAEQPLITARYIALVAPVMKPSATTPPTAPMAATLVKVKRPISRPVHETIPEPQKAEVAKARPSSEMPPVARRTPAEAAAKPAPALPVHNVNTHVNTNVFASERSDLPVVHELARKVQTGGFGDPNGLPGQGDPKRETINATNVGSFDLPDGSGKGNGTGRSSGTSARIRTSQFADASKPQVLGARNENVVAGGFGDVIAETKSADAQQLALQAHIQPVQILFKPVPAYTPQARRLGVQGEVLLDVVFEASGALEIKRVVKGLGYGLDDMALAAARQIQFRPALRDGQPYDCAALVHIHFELAD